MKTGLPLDDSLWKEEKRARLRSSAISSQGKSTSVFSWKFKTKVDMHKTLQFILSLFFPSFCVGCDAEGSFLCASCKDTLVIQRAPVPRAHASVISLTFAATEYREQPLIQKLVTTLKYKGAKDIAHQCADIIGDHLSLSRFSPPADAIMTAVPLHAKRLRERGFNQSDLIARLISSAYAIPYDSRILARTIHTTPQTEVQERAKRLTNVQNAFACTDPAAVRGKTVMLVDDVTTTGATLEACARTLKEAGARKVIAYVVAK